MCVCVTSMIMWSIAATGVYKQLQRAAPCRCNVCLAKDRLQFQLQDVWLASQVEGRRGGHANHSHLSGEVYNLEDVIKIYKDHVKWITTSCNVM